MTQIEQVSSISASELINAPRDVTLDIFSFKREQHLIGKIAKRILREVIYTSAFVSTSMRIVELLLQMDGGTAKFCLTLYEIGSEKIKLREIYNTYIIRHKRVREGNSFENKLGSSTQMFSFDLFSFFL